MGVPRGTTPTFTLELEAETLDLTAAESVYVSFSSRGVYLEKTGEELVVRAKEVDVYLSQEETLEFMDSQVEIQVNWTYPLGRRSASEIATYKFTKQLLDRVVE